MKTAVVTDSNSGISRQEAEELGIFVLPMPVLIDGKIYYEGIDLTEKVFYDCLRAGKNVITSQPSPGEVIKLWEEVLGRGYGEIIYIPMSSGLSNSCHSAMLFAREFEGRVQVADNHRISATQKQSVLDARHLAAGGMKAAEIKEKLEETAFEASIYIAVDTLEFLKKGGRITPAAAAFGSVLNIKPVLTIQGDRLDAFAKVRGMKKCLSRMIEAAKADMAERFPETDSGQVRVGTAGTFSDAGQAEAWRRQVEEAFPGQEVSYDPLSCSIGCHVGPEAVGIGVFRTIR